MFSDTAMLVKMSSKSQRVSIIENHHVSPIKKTTNVFASDKKSEWMGTTSEREIEKGERSELFGYHF